MVKTNKKSNIPSTTQDPIVAVVLVAVVLVVVVRVAIVEVHVVRVVSVVLRRRPEPAGIRGDY